MNKSKGLLSILMLVTVLSQSSKGRYTKVGTIKLREVRYPHCNNDSACPTWFICNSQNICECGNEHSYKVVCDIERGEAAVLDCHCVTYDRQTGSTYLGLCFYNCISIKKVDHIHHKLPQKPEVLLNKSVCASFHRTGLLCGDCEEGYSQFVLSYNLSCVKCPNGHKNWWKFILAGSVPLTFFYFFVVIFNINVTSSRLHGVVWFSQVITIPAFIRLMMSELSHRNPHLLIAAKTFIVFYSFWNLDLFRSVIPDICLNVTTLQALALDYCLALYPFLLILLSYLLIELHDRRFAVVVIIWKLFHKVLSVFRKSWDIRTSIIDSFATFFLLSYIKVLSVSADLLIPTTIYKLGSNEVQYGLYYTPTVHYFGNEYLPYAITAIIILTLFVSIPTIIFILYPFQLFQKFLSYFPFNWHFLHAFVDSFQGCYKDGTEPGTFDCRWFSTLIHLIRLLFFIIYGMTLSMMSFVYCLIVFLITPSIFAINIQPYKKVACRYSIMDTVFYILLSLICIALITRDVAKLSSIIFNTLYPSLTASIPIVYIAIFISFWIISKMRCVKFH